MPETKLLTADHLEAELVQRGIRITRQRRAILQSIEEAERHLNATQILRRAKRLEPGVDRVTVYRTLSLLKKHGVIDELDLMHVTGDAHYYERKSPHVHAHVTCLVCGRVLEFRSDYLDQLQCQIKTQCDFEIQVIRVEVGGRCTRCKCLGTEAQTPKVKKDADEIEDQRCIKE